MNLWNLSISITPTWARAQPKRSGLCNYEFNTKLADSDYACIIDDRTSTSGFLFNLGSRAVSFEEARSGGLINFRGLIYCNNFCTLSISLVKETYCWFSSGGTESFVTIDMLLRCRRSQHSTKHIYIHFHFNRSLFSAGEITLKSCDTNEQATYIFTKSLRHAKHDSSVFNFGVCSFESMGSIEKWFKR